MVSCPCFTEMTGLPWPLLNKICAPFSRSTFCSVSPSRGKSHTCAKVANWYGLSLLHCSPLPLSFSLLSSAQIFFRSRFENNLRWEAWEFGSVLSAAAKRRPLPKRRLHSPSFCEPLFLIRQYAREASYGEISELQILLG